MKFKEKTMKIRVLFLLDHSLFYIARMRFSFFERKSFLLHMANRSPQLFKDQGVFRCSHLILRTTGVIQHTSWRCLQSVKSVNTNTICILCRKGTIVGYSLASSSGWEAVTYADLTSQAYTVLAPTQHSHKLYISARCCVGSSLGNTPLWNRVWKHKSCILHTGRFQLNGLKERVFEYINTPTDKSSVFGVIIMGVLVP